MCICVEVLIRNKEIRRLIPRFQSRIICTPFPDGPIWWKTKWISDHLANDLMKIWATKYETANIDYTRTIINFYEYLYLRDLIKE